jgi:N-succinyldiaminopimelate aminotransferase
VKALESRPFLWVQFESSRGLKFVSVAVPSVQHAAAAALAIAEEHGARLAAELEAKRDRLCEGLERAGATVLRPAGTYFANADVRPLGYDDGVTFCRELPERAGVVAIPTSVFCGDPERARSLVRFAFCKREEVIDEAAARLATLRRPHPTA